MNGSTWTDEQISELIRLWPTHSAAQIAARLHCSREAVTGKARRLRDDGLLPPCTKHYLVKPNYNRIPPPGRGRPPQLRPFNPGTDPADGSLAMHPCSLLDLDDRRCHWPLGDVHAVALQFCGGAVVSGQRYCAHHQRMARQSF